MSKMPDKIDKKIIEQLRFDGRMPNTEIAKKLGVSEGTVRRRIHAMIGQGLIRAAAIVDPAVLGYNVFALITIQTVPSRGKEVAQRIAELPEVHAVSLLAGEFDMIASAYFKSNTDLADFLTEKMAYISGISRTETLIILDVVKDGSNWAPPI